MKWPFHIYKIHMAILPKLPSELRKKSRNKNSARPNKAVDLFKEEIPKFGPCSIKQQIVLQDMDTDLLLIGGGAGGGKSMMALVKALKYVEDPAAIVLIVRLTYPLLKAAGGLVAESKHIYPYFGAVYKEQKMEWIFPNGAMIKFYAIPDNLSELQGQQYSNVIVDEAAEASLESILAIRARLRAVRYKGKLNLLMTCNPSRQSWLYDFVSYSLDADGVPFEGTENITRWFVILSGKIYWGTSKEELFKEYGAGYVFNETFRPLSFRFIPMTIYDNPILLKGNPAYLADLMAQSRVNQLRFLKGSWTAQIEGASFIKREWFQYVNKKPKNVRNRVRGWDTAATLPSEVRPDPDYTAGVLISRDREGIYYIENCQRFRMLTDGVLKEISTISKDDGYDVSIVIEKDPGGAGKIANQFFVRYLAERGSTVHSTPVNSGAGKLKRFLPFASLCESGAVRIVRYDNYELDSWIEPFLVELESFTGSSKLRHDDMVDATSCGFNWLCRSIDIPDFTLPIFEQMASPIVRI